MESLNKLLKRVTIVSEEGDKKVYSGDEILLKLTKKTLEPIMYKYFPMMGLGSLMGQLEEKDLEVSPTSVKLVDRAGEPQEEKEENPSAQVPKGGRLGLNKKARRTKRNRRNHKRQKLRKLTTRRR
jgi:hypothetical protein